MRAYLTATVCLSALLLTNLPARGAPLTPDAAAELSLNVDRPVIIFMKNQLSGERAAADQSSLMGELRQVGAQRVKSYRLVNAMAATVSEGEEARLKADPSVAMVVPDTVIRGRPRNHSPALGRTRADSSQSPPLNTLPGSCPKTGKVQLNPEALLTTNTDSDDTKAKTARSLGATGAGVKVAWIADGIDPLNPNFIRPDGTKVFIDYQDFTGDGPGQPTAGGEAFLDASSIAAQGTVVYDISQYSLQTLPSPCNIRVEGVAPGASLVGLDVFGTFEATTESNFLQAIDYAVTVDHVDVLNESFGNNGIPDSSTLDATKMFDDAAVAAGVTVTVSSGDAGITSTIGSPSTDPLLIGVGASTTFRIYAQINEAGTRYFATTGWLDDNISALSSGGFEQSARTIDLVAPGDLNWASCEASATYADCTNFLGAPSNFTDSGGTSESAPLTAGAAALVIEAYRKTHGGASPSPALVKQILTSSASDLGLPATEQGAGILDTYKAVLLARSINSADGQPTPTGSTLLLSQDQLTAVDKPNAAHAWTVKVTNTGAASQNVHLAGRTLGADSNVQSGTVTLTDGTSPTFIGPSGVQENYAPITIQVPAGADRLFANIAYPPANQSNRVAYLLLIDPHGKVAAYTLPQGVADYGTVDVRKPAEGAWTGIIYSRTKALGGVSAPISWRAATESFVPFGKVEPASLTLAAGQSRTVRVTALTPGTPGDIAGSIVVKSSDPETDPYLGVERGAVSVTLRSLIEPAQGGAFSGVLTGGNGRAGTPAQVSYYGFKVGSDVKSIAASVSLTNDFTDGVKAFLINPSGVAVGFGQNTLGGTSSASLTANTVNPEPGLWTLIVYFAQPIAGDEISQAFTGNVVFNQVSATASGLPNDPSVTLAAGTPVTVPVTITNSGSAPQAYFVDARLGTPIHTSLAQQAPAPTKQGYPLPVTQYQPEWLVPTQTSDVRVSASATLPVEFDFGPFQGDPDLFGAPTKPNHASGNYKPGGGTVQPGLWFALPDEIGPYPNGASSGYAKVAMSAVTLPFDPAVTSSTNDFWLASVGQLSSFSPVTLNPGQSAIVDVTITPAGAPGTAVTGTIYVDDYIPNLLFGQTTGNEVAALPYSYTVGAPAAAAASEVAGHATQASTAH